MKRLFLFITCFVCYTCAVEVGTTNGVVSGVQLLTGDQKVNVWRGVPYANPPTNEQRFHYAVAKDAWTGRYNATFYRPNCYPGYSLDNVATSYSEDCLYINIFADNRCLSKLCPVIFYINSSPYDLREDPKFNENLIVKKFASKNFVVVVPQYRQGIFGNLDLGRSTGSAPYNLQLWDLIQALEWTNHEIGSFGGASDRVALMGQGAGADDVIYLATSTRINPSHFNRIIVFSGIAPILYHPSQKISVEVSETVGCHNSSSLSDELLCLQNTSFNTLISAIPSGFPQKSSLFRPQIDNLLIYSDLWENPKKYFNSKPLLAITNEFEDQNLSNEQEECVESLSLFGYFSKSSLNACENFFNDSAEIANSAKNAFFVRLASVNKRETFIGVTAEDIFTELDDLESENSSFIKEFFPDVIRRFVMTGQPYTDWPKTDKEGQNFYYIKVDLNSTSKIFPSPINNQHFDENGVHFWLDTLAEVEKNSTLSTDKINFESLQGILHSNGTEIRRKNCCTRDKFRWLPWTRNRCPCSNSTDDDVGTTTSSTTRQTTIFDHKSHHNRNFTDFPWKKGHSRRFGSSTRFFGSSTVTYSTPTTRKIPQTSNWTRFRHSERHSNTQIYPIKFSEVISSTISPENPQNLAETTTKAAENATAVQDTAPNYYDTLLWTRYINFLTFFIMIIMAVGIVGLSRLLYYQMAARGGESARKNLGELRQILTTTPPQKGYGLIDE